MNSKQLEAFLRQNNLTVQGQSITQDQTGQCIFCSIISEKIPSYKIEDNQKALAVLDIRPASKGHSLIIPKEHISDSDKIPKQVLKLAEKVSEKIKTKLKTKDVKIESSNLFGHAVINLIPIYNGEEPKPLDSEREPEDEKILLELQNLLQIKSKAKTIKKPTTKKIKKGEKLRLPRRIP